MLAGWWLDAGATAGNPYIEFRAAEIKRCEAIDPAEYQSGLLFNPDGHRSFYARSVCFQNAAVKFRDAALCAQVKERWSLFSSSWGYSTKHCRELVAAGMAADRKSLEETKGHYKKGAVRLRDFRVVRNGNGSDFDIIPSLEPGYAHGYMLRFELIDAEGAGGGVLFASSGFHLKGGDNIWIFVRQADIRQRFPRFELQRTYRMRATLVLSIGFGGQGGMLSDAFIERVFPATERTQTLVKEIAF